MSLVYKQSIVALCCPKPILAIGGGAKSHYSDFKGRSFRLMRLDKIPPEVLEGMELLEEKRAVQWRREGEIRAQRRAEGIMYDEDIIEGQKVRYLYEREFKMLHSQDREIRNLFLVIIGSLIVGVIAFILIRRDLMKRRRNAMLEKRMKAVEERKRREREKQVGAEVMTA